jgi:DNA-binding SARP family transcriptional activator
VLASDGVEFRILGPLEVIEQGRPLTLGRGRQRTLLALLLTRANEIVSADRLIHELWGAQPPRTAANALQFHVSQLRKALAPHDPISTQEPGYMISAGPEELDLLRFEALIEEARRAAPELAARRLRDALALWRGPALADLADGSFAQSEIPRLEELHLEALELRFDVDLTLGRHAELVGEVQALVSQHPLREGLRALLMRALYGSDRQTEALEVFRQTRELLVEELGIEPGPTLQELEQAILRHDPELTSKEAVAPPPRKRAIMVVVSDPARLDDLLAIAEPLARRPAREIILARLVRDPADLAAANAALAERRDVLRRHDVSSRIATYTTGEAGADVTRLATEHEVDLILLDAPHDLLERNLLDQDLGTVLERAPCDVGVLSGDGRATDGPVVTPFGGVEHDWAAIEVAAWLAQSLGVPLRLLGTEADAALGRRDASRLLARASLVVQQVVGITTEPVLVRTGERGVLEASRDARLLVVGLSDRWRTEGIGQTRIAVALGADVPTLFVRRGLRPGGVAPNETLTRFTWTLGAERILPPD